MFFLLCAVDFKAPFHVFPEGILHIEDIIALTGNHNKRMKPVKTPYRKLKDSRTDRL